MCDSGTVLALSRGELAYICVDKKRAELAVSDPVNVTGFCCQKVCLNHLKLDMALC